MIYHYFRPLIELYDIIKSQILYQLRKTELKSNFDVTGFKRSKLEYAFISMNKSKQTIIGLKGSRLAVFFIDHQLIKYGYAHIILSFAYLNKTFL